MSEHGGKREGAGRKPKAKEIELIEKLSPLEDKAFEALENGIISGEFPFVKLFMEYRFGKPKDSLDITTKGESVKSISPIEWVKDATDKE